MRSLQIPNYRSRPSCFCSRPARHFERLRSAPVLGVIALFLVLGAAVALACDNETPKKKNAIIYGPHPSAQGVDECLKQWLCAENYSVSRLVWGRGEGTPTLGKLRDAATNGFAVLVIIAHGSSDSLTLEDYETEKAAKAAYDKHVADAKNKDIKDELNWGKIEDPEPGKERWCVWTTAKGLNKLFGGADGNRSIVCVMSCKSWELQTTNSPKPFGATEYLGFSGDLSNRQRAKGKYGFELMGGSQGIPKRPVKPAFAGRMEHQGPGNTVLAPACIEHAPPSDSVLPLFVKTDGHTKYETIMNTKNVNIMTPEGCEAVISDEKWASDCLHEFKVTPAKPGRLTLRVQPKVAISKNNDNWLIGNWYRLPKTLEEDTGCSGRPTVDDCQFGQSGLDGQADCVPPENPYRWCVWCKEIPQDPGTPRTPSDPPRSADDSGYVPQGAPWGETRAWVLYQDAPNDNTTFEFHADAPNFDAYQIGEWYAHMIFTPEEWQLEQKYPVQYFVIDDNGPRNQGVFEYRVVPRNTQLTTHVPGSELAKGDLGLEAIRPGGRVEYAFLLTNDGNTVVRDLELRLEALQGPGTIPGDSVTIEPALVEVLAPQQTVSVLLSIQTDVTTTTGPYDGLIGIHGTTNVEPANAKAVFQFQLNAPPNVVGPIDPIAARVGEPLQVVLKIDDSDGDALLSMLDIAPPGSSLRTEGGELILDWTPRRDQIGTQTYPVIVDDGWTTTVHELRFNVADNDCDSDRPTVLYVDAAAVGADDGTSWVDAVTDLARALHIAECSGAVSEVWVADGSYKPDGGTGDRTRSFALVDGVALYGGFAGTEEIRDQRDPKTHHTVLSGDLFDDDGPAFGNRDDNSYHVVTVESGVGSASLLDGFTVSGGNADGDSDGQTYFNDAGGGLRIDHAGPTVRNCKFTDNRAKFGGGVENFFSTASFFDVTFEVNLSLNEGGGLHNNRSALSIERAVFNGNVAEGLGGGCRFVRGGGTYLNCRFENNSASSGGALHIDNQSAPTFYNAIFRSNHADSDGGAILIDRNSSPLFAGLLGEGNSAFGRGGLARIRGGASEPQLVNGTLIANRAPTSGGVDQEDGKTALINCILYYNEDDGGMTESSQLNKTGGSFAVSHCDIQNWSGSHGGPGNFGAEPRLVEPSHWDGEVFIPGDPRPKDDSPLRDAGDTGAVPPGLDHDLDGSDRVIDGVVDVGGYELDPYRRRGIPGDSNCDGVVDFDDIDCFVTALISYQAWLDCGGNPNCDFEYVNDINHDGNVNFDDIDSFVECLISEGCP